jgi:hypothetical protein
MKKINFNELSMTDKSLLVAEFGCHLEAIEFYDYWIHLYSLHQHFIELHYNVGTRQIDKIRMCNYLDLDKYLDRILIKPF